MWFQRPGESCHLGDFLDARPAPPRPEDDDGRLVPHDLLEGEPLPLRIGHAHRRERPANRTRECTRQGGGGGRVQEPAPLRAVGRMPGPPSKCAGLPRERSGVGSHHREGKRRTRGVAPSQPQFPQPPEEPGFRGLGRGRFKDVEGFFLESGFRQQLVVFDQSIGPGPCDDAGVFAGRLSERASGVSGEIHRVQIGHGTACEFEGTPTASGNLRDHPGDHQLVRPRIGPAIVQDPPGPPVRGGEIPRPDRYQQCGVAHPGTFVSDCRPFGLELIQG